MKSPVYLIILVLLVPLQAGLLNLVSIRGVAPDLGIALLYIIGLYTGPFEASLAGMGIGLLLDIGSAGLLGVTGISRGLIGFVIGLVGRNVIDIGYVSHGIFLAAFSLIEGCCVAVFLQLFYGSVSFVGLLTGRLIPQALYTSLLGIALLHIVNNRNVLSLITRRTVQKEL